MSELETVMLKESVHLLGAYRDYFSKDHKWVNDLVAQEYGVDIVLDDERTLAIPSHNVAGEVKNDE